MLYEVLLVASFFATRIVLPVIAMLVVGEWMARRAERRESKS